MAGGLGVPQNWTFSISDSGRGSSHLRLRNPLGLIATAQGVGGSHVPQGICTNPLYMPIVPVSGSGASAHDQSCLIHLPVGFLQCSLHGAVFEEHSEAAVDPECHDMDSFGHTPV